MTAQLRANANASKNGPLYQTDLHSSARQGFVNPLVHTANYPTYQRPSNACLHCFIMGKACNGYKPDGAAAEICGQCQNNQKAYCNRPALYLQQHGLSASHRRYASKCNAVAVVGPAVQMPEHGWYSGNKYWEMAHATDGDKPLQPLSGQCLGFPGVEIV